MKMFKKILTTITVVMFVVLLVSCGDNNNNDDTNKYEVEFVNTDLDNALVSKGETIDKPADPKKDGFIFEGWFEDEDFQTDFDFSKEIDSDLKVYAFYTITFEKALELGKLLEHDTVSNEIYYVRGVIKSIDNSEYGNMTITDGESDFYVYGVFGEGDIKYHELDPKPVVRDEILVKGVLKNFGGDVEFNNTTLVSMTEGEIPDFDVNDYDEATLLEARNKEVGSKVLVEGVVAQKTKQSNNKFNGVYITDETEALYIHNAEIASSVEVGEKIKVAGERVNFILESEKGFAEKFGYEGAIQLDSATLVEHNKDSHEFNLDWVKETTIKDLLDTDPNDENITGTIFKVKAFINKSEGKGFTNYYFNDLDNQTGSYTYTMNDGNDFTWLDEYDGELRYVYLSVINAKSTVSEIVYRLLPIKIDDVYEYDVSYSPEYAVKFHGLDQFEDSYTNPFSPERRLVESIDIDHFDVSNVTLEYSSDNEDVAEFVRVDDELVFRTNEVGKANITIKATYESYEYSKTIEVEVLEGEDVDIIDVNTAINEDTDETVYVEGVVGPSLVNKVGFYLVDETGLIAVEMSSNEFSKLRQGNKVIIKGTKTYAGQNIDEDGTMYALGMTAIRDAEIMVNMQGEHEYSTDSFNGGKKEVTDLMDLDRLEDYSTTVFELEAKVVLFETPFYTRYQIEDEDGNYLLVYSSSANQLRFLKDFDGQTVTLEFTFVNWNGKNWSGSLLAVITEDGKFVNDANFR